MSTEQKPLDNSLLSKNQEKVVIDDQINQESILEKANHVKDDYLIKIKDILSDLLSYQNLTLEKVYQYKQKAIETGSYYKEQALEKANTSKFGQYTDETLNNVLTYMEKQVQQASNYHKTIASENNLVENTQEQSTFVRIKNLSQTVNTLARLSIQEQLGYIASLPISQSTLAFYQQVYENEKIQEILMFSSITQEFLTDFYLTKLYTPSVTYFSEKYSSVKKSTQITVENVRTNGIKSYLPLVISSYVTLKNSTIHFYKNQMTVEFAQEYYQTNKVLIQKEMKDFYGRFMKYQENFQVRSQEAYISALQQYKERRQAKISQLKTQKQKAVKNIPEEQNHKKNE